MDSTASCVTRKGDITTENKGIQCGQCKKIFHATCTQFTTVLTTANEKIKACRPCITAANTPNLQTRLRGNKSGTSSPISSSDGSDKPSMDKMLETICGKLDKLEKLDSIEKTTASFESRFTGKLDELNLKAAALDQLPELLSRMTSMETRMTNSESKKGPNISSPSSPPIVVSLSSPALARELVNAKIRKRKLHTAELDTNLIRDAGITTSSIPSGLTNINEFLLKEIHELRNETRKQLKLRGFVSFIRNGDIHVRRGNDSSSSIIANQEQLANFLERI